MIQQNYSFAKLTQVYNTNLYIIIHNIWHPDSDQTHLQRAISLLSLYQASMGGPKLRAMYI